ncbi:unnamed protein product [Brassica rapa]|uniref:Uncharacterized protein n=1 Tax=Brassica campestris TaxID=3711 RepID=A0A3P5YNS8_BRACM|nr:unnamed protein product [Brassica rapa]VDC63010.1 unnamed protein product [Brassica rapa]
MGLDSKTIVRKRGALVALLRRGCALPVSVLYIGAWLNGCIRFRVGKLEAVIFNLPSPNDGIAGCCFLLVLPVWFFLGGQASSRCDSLWGLWHVGRSEAVGTVCFKV